MNVTNYEVNLHADSYPELREAIARLAEEHGIAVGRTSQPAMPDCAVKATPDAKADEGAEEPQATAETQADDTAESEELVWYHQPDERAVWQEEKQGRRKGIYQINEKTALEIKENYAAEDAQADAAAQQEKVTEDEPNADTADTTAAAEDTQGEQSEPVQEAEAGESESAEEPSPTADASEAPELTLDDVRQAVMAFAKANGNPQGKALVASYDASKLSEVAESDWQSLYDEAVAGTGGA